jgi:hypothetical protein
MEKNPQFLSQKKGMSLQSEALWKMKLQFKQAFHISKCPLNSGANSMPSKYNTQIGAADHLLIICV